MMRPKPILMLAAAACSTLGCMGELADEAYEVGPAFENDEGDERELALYFEELKLEDRQLPELAVSAQAAQTHRVANKAQFIAALAKAKSGDVIEVDPWSVIDLTGARNLRIPGGVNLRGGRSAEVPGALLRTRERNEGWKTWVFMRTGGSNVHVEGMRFEGPDGMITSAGSYMATGLHFGHPGGLVENCEFYHWPAAGVSIAADNTTVSRSYLHDNIRWGRGYGIVVGGTAVPLIEENTFDRNRHAIAGSGFGGYTLKRNTFLGNPYLHYYGWNPFTESYHRGGMHSQVDMHGVAEALSKPDSTQGGTRLDITENRFAISLGDLTPWDPYGNLSVIGIRGIPAERALIERNCSLRSDHGWVGQFTKHRFDTPPGPPWGCYCKGGSAAECSDPAVSTAKWLCSIPKFGNEMQNVAVRNNRLGSDKACRPPLDIAFRGRPYRALDTRKSGARPKAGSTHCFQVTGRGGIPSSAKTVALNLTAVGSTGHGFFTSYASGTKRPNASTLNHQPGQVIANGTFVEVGSDKKVCVFAHAATHVVADVMTHYDSNDFTGVTPTRNLDTRPDSRVGPHTRLRAGKPKCVKVRGTDSVPANARAVAVNLVAVNPADNGFLTAYRSGQDVPEVSNVNYQKGETVGNGAVLEAGDDGKICVFSHASTDLVVDTLGYFGAKGRYRPIKPYRLRDSRTPKDGKMWAGGMRCMKVTGHHGVPESARQVSLNVAAVNPHVPGYLTVFPYGLGRPSTSSLNYEPGAVRSNHAMVKTGSGGRICVYSHSETDYIFDVRGYLH